MGKLKSPEEISRRFNPVTEGDLDSSGLDSESTESVSSKIDFGVWHLEAAISSADYCALELLEPSPASAPEPELPGNLEELIGRRAEAEARFAGDQQPEPGKIIALQLDSPGTETAVAQEPVAVLLDVLESDNRTWRGWVVSRDRAYATNWDLILGPEEGELDPLCEIVQTWNPVRVVLPARIRVLGQLSPYRLAAARTLAVNGENGFISGPPGEHRIGVALARELSDGTGVVTGSSIAESRRPAHRVSADLSRDRRQAGGTGSSSPDSKTPADFTVFPATPVRSAGMATRWGGGNATARTAGRDVGDEESAGTK